MTEQPDTAAIRAKAQPPEIGIIRKAPSYEEIRALCDALDAARAERDEVKGLLDDKSRRDDTALMAYKREKHRAEAAEAKHHEAVQGWYDCTLRAEAAEALIANALVVCRTDSRGAGDLRRVDSEAIERALTGDTT